MDHGSAKRLFVCIINTLYRQRGCSVDSPSAEPWKTLCCIRTWSKHNFGAIGLQTAAAGIQDHGHTDTVRIVLQHHPRVTPLAPHGRMYNENNSTEYGVGRNDSLCYLRVFLPACPLNSRLNRCARIGSRVALRGRCLTGRATARLKTGSKPSDAGVLGRVQAPDAQMSG